MRRLLSPLLLLAALAATTPAARAITYAAWVASYGLTGAAAEATADPDGDGKPNLLEYALAGCNPTVADTALGRTTFVFGTRTGAALPSVDPTAITYFGETKPTTGSYHIGLRYTPRADAEGILYLVEYADPQSELQRWFSGRSAIATAVNIPVAGDHVGWALSMFDQTQALLPRAFLRLRITLAP